MINIYRQDIVSISVFICNFCGLLPGRYQRYIPSLEDVLAETHLIEHYEAIVASGLTEDEFSQLFQLNNQDLTTRVIVDLPLPLEVRQKVVLLNHIQQINKGNGKQVSINF